MRSGALRRSPARPRCAAPAAVEANGGAVVKGTGRRRDGHLRHGRRRGGRRPRRPAGDPPAQPPASRGPALSIRVGLSVGDVSFETGDCFGEPVVEAARLCAVAEGDQILATASGRTAARGEARAPGFEDRRRRSQLKGLPDPVDVVEVEWERLGARPRRCRRASAAEPRPSSAARRSSSLLAPGLRGGERARPNARSCSSAASPGSGRPRSSAKRSGGGTTPARRSRWGGARRTCARRTARSSTRSATSWRRRPRGAPRRSRRAARLEPAAAGARARAHRVDGLPERVSTDLETERFLLFVGGRRPPRPPSASTRPVVLFLDDLHWADAGTASLLRSLATVPDPARLLIVGTFRSDELRASTRWDRRWPPSVGSPPCRRLDLDGPPQHRHRRARRALDAAPTAEPAAMRLADDLVAETDGNAFFVTEVVRHLDETGPARRAVEADPPARTRSMPDSIREVLGERVARLGSAADEVLADRRRDRERVRSRRARRRHRHGRGEDARASSAMPRRPRSSARSRTLPVASCSPTPSCSTRSSSTSAPPARPASTGGSRRCSRPATRRASPVAELAHHWLQATRRVRQRAGHGTGPARRATTPWRRSPPVTRVAYFRQALLLHDQLRDDDVAMRIDLLIKLGTAERQAGRSRAPRHAAEGEPAGPSRR